MSINVVNRFYSDGSARSKLCLLAAILNLLPCLAGASADTPVVELANGYTATGSRPDKIDINHFVAIPYALAPTDDRRWRHSTQ